MNAPHPDRFEPTDGDLLERVAQHDLDAYEALYDRYANAVYSLILRMVSDGAVADEVLQETFWQVWQSAAEYRGSGAVRAWVFRIARNRSLDELRRHRARPQAASVDVEAAASQVRPQQPSAETEAEQRLDRHYVAQALQHLPPEQRTCLELAYFEGLSQREIAERVNVPVGTVKSRLRIGLDKLERLLRRDGYP